MEINKSLVARYLGNRLVIDGKPFVGGICLHDTAGSGTHNDTLYLAHPGDGRVVSVDFTVERDGSIYQLNPDLENKCTFHAGRATKFVTAGRVLNNKAVTQSVIGIELVHRNNPVRDSPIWPALQIEAVAWLCLDLCKRFGLTKEQITTHEKIITDRSRSDPRNFPFDSFWLYFNRAANAATLDPGTFELGRPIVYEVVKGDSLFKIANKFGTSIEAIKSLNEISTASNLIVPGQKLVVKN